MEDRAEVIDAGAAAEVRAAAEAYCVALHRCDVAALGRLFAPEAHLYTASGAAASDLPRDAWLARVAAREVPAPEDLPDYAVELVDASGPETALARVTVRVGPRRFTDYLSFLKLDGGWRVIAKVYRLAEGPPL